MTMKPASLTIRWLSTTCISPTPQLSTTHRGTAFEERSLRILQEHLSMSLRRVGGKSDGGIDLLGWWWLPATDPSASNNLKLHQPPPRRRLRILAQCKAEKKKTSPKYVREMEGVLHRYMSLSSGTLSPGTSSELANSSVFQPSQYPLVALLISESPFTTSTVLRAQSSPVPFFLLHIPPVPESSDQCAGDQDWIGSAVWNPALAGVGGLLGGKFEARWERSTSGGGRPSLWWQSRKLASWTPDSDSSEINALDLDREDKIFEDLAEKAR